MTAKCINILLVEDDEDDYLLTTEFLGEIEDFEHEVHWAPTFQDGVDLLRDGSFDICLVDFRIGGLTGLEFVEQAKLLGGHEPIVFLTGMGDRQMDIAAMEAGAYDFLQKSELTTAILDRTIRYAISQARNRRFLMERTALLQATLDNTGAGIAAVGTNGRLVTWNDRVISFLSKLAIDAGEAFPERDDRDALTGLVVADRFPILRQACAEYVCGDGMILSINRNDIAEGGAVLVVHDITQQKLTEQAMRDAMQQAEAASRAKSAFLANMSHELRTPLNAIIGFADLIMGQAQGPIGCADYEGYVSYIQDSGRNLLNIINTTIDLARIEADDYPLDISKVGIADIVAMSIRQVEAVATEAQVTFDVSAVDEALTVNADANAVAKMLTQIMSNAVKFSQQGDAVVVRAYADKRRMVLEVEDRGIGMESAEIARALSSFSQVDEQLARKYEGAGLGLPLARALAELQGGALAINSARRQGTTVQISLPLGTASDQVSTYAKISA
jgi:signal transduction histidine kinase